MSDESTHLRTASALHDEDGQSWSKVTSSNRFAVLANLDDESCDITMSQDVPNRRTSLRHKSPKCKAKKKTVHWDDNIVNVTQINPPSTSQSIPGGPANPDAAPMPSRFSSADTRKNPVKVMVIGSSNAWGVAPLVSNNHIDATGFSYPGCTAGQITDRIQSIHCSGVTVIHAGSYNLEAHPLAKCMAELQGLAESVQNRKPTNPIIVCEIPYRYDKPELNDKVDLINNYLSRLCRARPTCHLLAHDYNDQDYAKDRLHLNERGKTKLAYEIRRTLRHINIE